MRVAALSSPATDKAICQRQRCGLRSGKSLGGGGPDSLLATAFTTSGDMVLELTSCVEVTSGKHCAAFLRKLCHRKRPARLACRGGRLHRSCDRRSFGYAGRKRRRGGEALARKSVDMGN